MVAARATPEATTIVAAIAISENIMRFIASSPSFLSRDRLQKLRDGEANKDASRFQREPLFLMALESSEAQEVLFSGVRGSGILRTSRVRSSPKFPLGMLRSVGHDGTFEESGYLQLLFGDLSPTQVGLTQVLLSLAASTITPICRLTSRARLSTISLAALRTSRSSIASLGVSSRRYPRRCESSLSQDLLSCMTLIPPPCSVIFLSFSPNRAEG